MSLSFPHTGAVAVERVGRQARNKGDTQSEAPKKSKRERDKTVREAAQ